MLIMLNAPPALKSGEKISIFSATKDFIEVLRVMVACSIQPSLLWQCRSGSSLSSFPALKVGRA